MEIKMSEHEIAIKEQLINERENDDILRRYQSAIRDMGDEKLTFTAACIKHGLIIGAA